MLLVGIDNNRQWGMASSGEWYRLRDADRCLIGRVLGESRVLSFTSGRIFLGSECESPRRKSQVQKYTRTTSGGPRSSPACETSSVSARLSHSTVPPHVAIALETWRKKPKSGGGDDLDIAVTDNGLTFEQPQRPRAAYRSRRWVARVELNFCACMTWRAL